MPVTSYTSAPWTIATFRARSAAPAVALGLAVALTGCGQGVTSPGGAQSGGGSSSAASSAPGSAAAQDASVTNCGEPVEVQGTPQRLVGMNPGSTELLLRLGLGERLVGQAQTATGELPVDVAAEAAEVPVLSEDVPPVREDLLAVEPDFVLSPTTYEFTAEQGFASVEQLAEAGAASYVATAGCPQRRSQGTVEDLFTDITDLGALLGVQQEAAALAEEYRGELEEVNARTEGRDEPTVAQVFVDGTTLSVTGAGIEYDIIDQAGGDNVFSPEDPQFADFFSAQINPEVLAAADPEVIVFAVSSPVQEQATRDYLTRTFPQTAAVEDDRLLAFDASAAYPGSPGNVRAVTEIAQGLYPDAF